MMFEDTLLVELPNPRKLEDLFLPKGEQLFIAKYDLDNYYHITSILEWMSDFFGWPYLTIDGVKYLSVVRTLPV